MIDRAYVLAHFILRRQDLALRVTEEALGRLEVAMAAQDKRLYYQPVRGGSAPSRSKVWLGEAHQLQRLVYIACEPYERARELGALDGDVTEEDLILHFVKHLTRITVRRNAFHVLLGVCRLLFNYPTSDTMEIHNQLVAEPEDVKDHSYYRARKAVLMEELSDRFGSLVTVVRQHRGEERFLTLEDSRPHLSFVAECLDRFAPWDTSCWPEGPNPPTRDTGDPELQRIHAALHPPCLRRLIAALSLEGLEDRLALPRLGQPSAGNEDDMTKHRGDPPALLPEERQGIERSLRQRSRARSGAAAGTLRIVVDGQERGRLDPAQAGQVSLVAPQGAEVMEVWTVAPGRELLLATALLGGREASSTLSLTLEAGQQLIARVVAPAADAVAPAGLEIAVSYRETRPWRVLRLAARRASRRLAAAAGQSVRGWRLGWSALAVAVLATASFELATRPWGSGPGPGTSMVEAPLPPPALPNAGSTPRSGRAVEAVVSDLQQVRAVFIEVKGAEPARQAAARQLADALRSSRFRLVTDKGVADAVLKVDTTSTRRGVRLMARLVNAEGDILWPAGLTRGGREVRGPLGTCAQTIVRELLGDPERLP